VKCGKRQDDQVHHKVNGDAIEPTAHQNVFLQELELTACCVIYGGGGGRDEKL
jgi:hypothetical protein